jgi:hypothetical protein
MNTIKDFARKGGWGIGISNSRKIHAGDVIFVTAGNQAEEASVRVVRGKKDVAKGSGWLTHVGTLYVKIGKLALTLSLAANRLFFSWDDGSGGPSPDGGGSSGGPGGHP